jgi:hypothetical protein
VGIPATDPADFFINPTATGVAGLAGSAVLSDWGAAGLSDWGSFQPGK